MRFLLFNYGISNSTDKVAKSCSREILEYSDCVTKNTESWATTCSDLKAALTKCSIKASPDLDSFRKKCQSSIRKFDDCVKLNQSSPQSKCQLEMKELYQCIEDNK